MPLHFTLDFILLKPFRASDDPIFIYIGEFSIYLREY